MSEATCKFHPRRDAVQECSECQTPLCDDCGVPSTAGAICKNCFALKSGVAARAREKARKESLGRMLTEARTREAEEEAAREPEPDVEEKARKRNRLYLALAVAGFGFMGYQFYSYLGPGAMLNEEEIQAEELARAQLAECMLVFWEIAELLENNRVPPESLGCVEAGASNIVIREGNNIIVRHPRPELHGYSEISVSSSNPTPILVE